LVKPDDFVGTFSELLEQVGLNLQACGIRCTVPGEIPVLALKAASAVALCLDLLFRLNLESMVEISHLNLVRQRLLHRNFKVREIQKPMHFDTGLHRSCAVSRDNSS